MNDHKYLDYNFIEYYRKALELSGPICNLEYHSIYRDFFVGSLKEIKYLIQFDLKPSILLNAKLDIYKISITFTQFRKR